MNRESRLRQIKYNEILKEKFTRKELFDIEMVKENQCVLCIKKNKRNCRLNMQNGICINYGGKK